MFGWLFGESEDSAKAWRSAALKYMGDRLPDINRFYPDQGAIDRAVVKLAEARRWVSAIEDKTMRRCCEHWCDHMNWQISEARKELATGGHRERDAQNERRWAREDADVDRILSRFQSGGRRR